MYCISDNYLYFCLGVYNICFNLGSISFHLVIISGFVLYHCLLIGINCLNIMGVGLDLRVKGLVRRVICKHLVVTSFVVVNVCFTFGLICLVLRKQDQTQGHHRKGRRDYCWYGKGGTCGYFLLVLRGGGGSFGAKFAPLGVARSATQSLPLYHLSEPRDTSTPQHTSLPTSTQSLHCPCYLRRLWPTPTLPFTPYLPSWHYGRHVLYGHHYHNRWEHCYPDSGSVQQGRPCHRPQL